MYEYWYYYLKTKYKENVKLYYIDIDTIIVHIKTKDLYPYLAEEVVNKRCLCIPCTGCWEKIWHINDSPITIGKNENVLRFMCS